MTLLLSLLSMIFCHLIADYNLQGIMANLKQKIWWEQKGYRGHYEKDYICALIEHSFIWTFCVFIPVFVLIYKNVIVSNLAILAIVFILNVAWHSYIDDLKANKFKLNLIQDQLAHLAQIIVTWLILVVI